MVRDFSLADHDQLVSVARDSWNLAYSTIYSKEVLNTRLIEGYSYSNHESMMPRIQSGELYFKVFLKNEKIIGFITGSIEAAYLFRLYISPKETKQGIGTKLLNLFINELIKRGQVNCIVDCNKKNEIGLHFYKENGFIIIDSTEEDFVLQKRLGQ